MNSFLRNLLGLNKNNQESGTFDNVISWEPPRSQNDNILNIHYRGLLKHSGASEVYLHYGFDGWNHAINTIKMDRMEDGNFQAEIKVENAHKMNLCFKDSAEHWDNNNGHNWNLQLL